MEIGKGASYSENSEKGFVCSPILAGNGRAPMTEVMNELVQIAPVAVGGELTPTVNARELHAFLEVGKVFAAWIQERINKYGFVENQDFVCVPVSESKARGGHNRIDYHVTIDMAKELSMVERNAKGKQARQYFIKAEKLWRAGPVAQVANPAFRLNPCLILRDPSNLEEGNSFNDLAHHRRRNQLIQLGYSKNLYPLTIFSSPIPNSPVSAYRLIGLTTRPTAYLIAKFS